MLIRKRLSILYEWIEQKDASTTRFLHLGKQKTLIQKYQIWNHSGIFLVPVRLLKKSLSIYEKGNLSNALFQKWFQKLLLITYQAYQMHFGKRYWLITYQTYNRLLLLLLSRKGKKAKQQYIVCWQWYAWWKFELGLNENSRKIPGWMILIWMTQLYSKNTCKGVHFSNSKGIQRKRCIFRIWKYIWLTSQIQYETDALCKSLCYFQ